MVKFSRQMTKKKELLAIKGSKLGIRVSFNGKGNVRSGPSFTKSPSKHQTCFKML